MNLLDEALAWHAAGYTPVPIRTDGEKRPIGLWKHLQQNPPTTDEVRRAFAQDTDGIGLICGATSGNLEMIEAEGRAVTEALVPQLAQAFTDHGLADLWARITGGYMEVTPSGGIHWYYRVDGPAAGNTKLARRPATTAELADDPDDKIKVLFETRGEGGFTVIAPSAGRTHDTGRPWTAVRGGRDTIPVLTVDERDAVYAVAGLLDQMPAIDEPATPARPRQEGDPLRPGDDYNTRAAWHDILTPHGWKVHRRFGGALTGWQRPGKRHPGVSATTGRNDADNLYVFSTSTEFEPEKPYSKFAAYTLLEHGGDYPAAARTLRAAGYGDQQPIAPPDPSDLVAPDQNGRHLAAVDGTSARVIEPARAQVAAIAHKYGPTEDGLARALAAAHQATLRYCPERGQWLTWNGSRWCWDTSNHHREHIKELARDLPDGDGWATFKKRALSAAGTSGVATQAQSDHRLTVSIDDLDARPYQLNTPDGIIDLHTGTLRPPSAEALHTRMTTVAPDYDRRSGLLERFLGTTFGGDRKLIAYVQRLLGISAIGTILEQILPFAHGSGANGKSTLIEATMTALGRGEGGYAIAAPAEMLMVRRHTEHPAELAQLAGARLVVCTELDDGQRFAEARIKQLTGRDSVNARFMRGNPFTFTPSHTIWLIGNHKPDATTGGPAFWRRLKLVPFDHVVPEHERDPHLAEKLSEEAPAILAWLARGAADYMTAGMRTPDAVQHATEAYAEDQDTIGRFVEEQCHRAPGQDIVAIQTRELREAYERWCDETGDAPVSARRLTQELRDRFGVGSNRSHGRRYYTGISLLIADESGTRDDAQGWLQ